MARREGSIVILFDHEGRLLLQQRDDEGPPEGYGRWAIPGGGREGDESPRDTALREFAEETDVHLERLRFYRTIEWREDEPHGPRTLHVFFADDNIPQEQISCHEGLAFTYWAPAEIANLRLNPPTRAIVDDFLASDQYNGTLAILAPYKVGVGVIEIDRWGRVLLQLRDADLPPERYPDMWSMPGGILHPEEAPDSGALREFEEETGHLLEHLDFFRLYRRDPDLPTSLTDFFHIYYVDADIPEEDIQVNEGQAFKYFAPGELASITIPPHARRILEDFLADAAYKKMFH